jgi:hypothetical protein
MLTDVFAASNTRSNSSAAVAVSPEIYHRDWNEEFQLLVDQASQFREQQHQRQHQQQTRAVGNGCTTVLFERNLQELERIQQLRALVEQFTEQATQIGYSFVHHPCI